MTDVYNFKTRHRDPSLSDTEPAYDGGLTPVQRRSALAIGIGTAAALGVVGIGTAAGELSSGGPHVVGQDHVKETVKAGQTFGSMAEAIASGLEKQGYNISSVNVGNDLHVTEPDGTAHPDKNDILPGDVVSGSVPLTK